MRFTWQQICYVYGFWNAKKNGTELPKPRNINEIKNNDENVFVSLIVADVEDYKAKYSKTVKKTLSVPFWLNELAEKENIKFSQLLQNALKEKLNLN